MAVTTEKPGPYAPGSVILSLLERHRSRGLPSPINAETLQRTGLVSDSLLPRTLQSLQTLDLITEAGEPTDTMERLRRSPEGEYKQRLAEWLNAAYADVLQFIDPATADETAIRDAFRLYNPVGQQARMVTLFVTLYAGAGLGIGVKGDATTAPRPRAPTPPRRTAPAPRSSSASKTPPPPPAASLTGLPPALMGLIASLPTGGNGWTQEMRDKFLTTFPVVLDYCIPIVEAQATPAEDE
ncbi:MAG: hypothetical protein FD144_4808 [Rhodospirillaceae bacterium]|nr:MAG: hypothetical protein FD144_4808 [Rhodospirillaceae bacterium]